MTVKEIGNRASVSLGSNPESAEERPAAQEPAHDKAAEQVVKAAFQSLIRPTSQSVSFSFKGAQLFGSPLPNAKKQPNA